MCMCVMRTGVRVAPGDVETTIEKKPAKKRRRPSLSDLPVADRLSRHSLKGKCR